MAQCPQMGDGIISYFVRLWEEEIKASQILLQKISYALSTFSNMLFG
jgi:hypothetical protein